MSAFKPSFRRFVMNFVVGIGDLGQPTRINSSAFLSKWWLVYLANHHPAYNPVMNRPRRACETGMEEWDKIKIKPCLQLRPKMYEAFEFVV